ncbi:MAG TPA: bifunctional shikimate kinase/3-dehydroquinate synthase [Candidatus Limnocylindrales bacterium]|nr:bifunctional shikimate kinase/3-dehydroquinate synthase [Candidatus Limnocylindrales bacterium]
MDVVLVGLSGSGKSVVGRRLAAKRAAAFVDLDAEVERAAGTTVAEIFATEGEAGFRSRERQAIERLGPGGDAPAAVVRRVISAGGGALVDPRTRWRLVRGRTLVWLDVRPEVAAQRLRNSRHVRPLVAGSRDPIDALRRQRAERERFYAAAAIRLDRVGDPNEVARAVDERLAAEPEAGATLSGDVLLRADTRIGSFVVGDGIAAPETRAALERLGARRAVVVSEPGAWRAAGERVATALAASGIEVVTITLPTGEDAKRLSVVERAAGELAAARAERTDPIVAIGGGALGDAAGFLAATWLRGVPLVHVPTTLVAQIDSSIGGKTAVDIEAGKNLVGAYHQPSAVVVDVSLLRTLDERQRRAALGEAAKMAALGDERLFGLLETDGAAIARGDADAWESGAVAELVERCLWAKVEVVLGDEREALDGSVSGAGRLALNLGHTVGHAIEAATGFGPVPHGEAVAYGLRAACRLGVAAGVTPRDRAERIERLLDALGLGVDPVAVDPAAVREAIDRDKKHAAGRLRWVLPTADGVLLSTDVADEPIERAIVAVTAGRSAQVGAAS